MRARPATLMLSLSLTASVAFAEQPSAPAEPEAETAAPVGRAPLPERSQARAQALERQLQADQQQQLAAGDERFLALWLPANASQSKGAVILLPGDGESADWPQVIGPLRRKLPDAGWHSLSLSLPDPLREPTLTAARSPAPAPETERAEDSPDSAQPQVNQPVAEVGSAEPAGASIDAAPADLDAQREAQAARVFARIQAGIAFAQQQQSKTLVLLGHGTGAYWAARYLEQQPDAPIAHLLLVDAALPERFGPALDELIPGLKISTGDFYHRDLKPNEGGARARHSASKRLAHPDYTQVALAALPGDRASEQEYLFRRLRGWLELKLKGAPPS